MKSYINLNIIKLIDNESKEEFYVLFDPQCKVSLADKQFRLNICRTELIRMIDSRVNIVSNYLTTKEIPLILASTKKLEYVPLFEMNNAAKNRLEADIKKSIRVKLNIDIYNNIINQVSGDQIGEPIKNIHLW